MGEAAETGQGGSDGARSTARFVRRQIPVGRELSHLPKFVRNYAGDSLAMFHEFGDAFYRKLGPASLFLCHPALVRHVLRTNVRNYVKGRDYQLLEPLVGQGVLISEGELWTRQRRLLAPEFRPGEVARFLPLISAELERLFGRWRGAIEQGESVDFGASMMRFALLVIGGAMFQTDFEGVATAMSESIETQLSYATRQMVTKGTFAGLPTPSRRRARAAELRFNRLVSRLIEDGHGTQSQADCPVASAGIDVVSRMLIAEDRHTGERMSDQQLHDETKNLIFAGYETTGVSMAWAMYRILGAPAVRARIVDELDAVVGGQPIALAHVEQLVYLRQVLLEVMRLYPAVPAVSRVALADDDIEGVAVAAGENVTIVPYVLHRHPEFWPDPERFDPDRFAPDRSSAIDDYAYMPFLRGRRACLGEHFAVLEMMVALATLLGRFEFERVDDEPIEIRPISTLHLATPLRLRVRPRA